MANAEEKKEKILTSAQVEKDIIIEKYETKAKQESASIIEKAKRDAEVKKERMISSATLKVRDEILSVKQEKIQEVFQLALQQLNKMDEAAFNQFLKTVINRMDFQGEVNLILGEDSPIKNITSLVNEINTEISAQGQKVVLSQEIKIGMSGFILEQNGVEMNCSFEALVNFMKDELEYEVATVLFR